MGENIKFVPGYCLKIQMTQNSKNVVIYSACENDPELWNYEVNTHKKQDS